MTEKPRVERIREQRHPYKNLINVGENRIINSQDHAKNTKNFVGEMIFLIIAELARNMCV